MINISLFLKQNNKNFGSEMYNEAVQDCSSAIQIYPNNIKAYYRQVLAYKAQKKYTDALKVAQTGHEKQPNVKKLYIKDYYINEYQGLIFRFLYLKFLCLIKGKEKFFH
ncbi:hypothetical protein KUTeg_004598 [Tegillarca granosa]|uniref:Uncharacterized protein n=1 Tax=Tegillarca granosa TaxID=220873 RepID=A0ABQ9FQE2_TEGGR|nr:hypothetical protein KUTeg_004598 [Tegillarca granosa]